MNRTTPSTGPAKARSKSVSLTNEIAVEAGDSPCPSVIQQGGQGENDSDQRLAGELLP